jgi:hypothetical protein
MNMSTWRWRGVRSSIGYPSLYTHTVTVYIYSFTCLLASGRKQFIGQRPTSRRAGHNTLLRELRRPRNAANAGKPSPNRTQVGGARGWWLLTLSSNAHPSHVARGWWLPTLSSKANPSHVTHSTVIFIVVIEWVSLSLFGCAAHMETC